jgi:Ran GTPase-activating protein (RanGAP) involved in mRNA processing and transport
MAMRCGFTVGRTTGEASLADQLKRYRPRKLDDKKENIAGLATNPAKESLVAKCIKIVVENFGIRPVTEIIPPPQMAEITNQLSVNLSPLVGARHVYNENYWKRCCVEKFGWHNCNLAEHGFLWKQLFFEKLLQEKLEQFDPHAENIEDLYELVDACMDYIFCIKYRQLPSHLDISELCSLTPNLTRLDVTYGVIKIGMNYERMLFGMKISDATSLAKAFDRTDTLTSVIMSGNMIDDDLLRMLMTGLIKNNTITHIDLSHNKITNHGARLLSKLLGENSVISNLNLADNQIHSEGGRYLARGIRENDSLLKLNLRLNRLTDDGCRLLLEGLQDNVTLIDLNLASNGAGVQSIQTLCSILRDPQHSINSLDCSGNEFIVDHFELLRMSLGANKSLTSIDLRNNPGYTQCKSTFCGDNLCMLFMIFLFF